MAAASQTTDSGPVRESGRITSLDLIRGVAVLGILLMNAVYFGLGSAPYFNLSAGPSQTPLDWAIGILGEVFVDQKFMGLFSLLFGAGMILFIDRASEKGKRAVLLNLWRNALLLLIGILHMMMWEGDVLTAYALSSVFLIALRKLPNRALISLGVVVFVLSIACTLVTQSIASTTDASLAGLWMPGEISQEEIIALPFLLGYFLRALGLILVGAGLYRAGFMNGGLPARTYRLTAVVGLAVGLPLAAAGVVITAVNDYSREIAFIGQIPNTLGTIPASLAYMSLIILWNNREDSWLKERLRAVGRMALTNYLSQTVLGLLVLTVLLGDADFVNRGAVLVFVFAVWAVQVWWSQAWLSRFLFGPAEWIWRVATYRSGQPIRRLRDSRSVG
ncbi:MAG: DUF418 domain-containing protein [Dehalococcoidia bacterium]|nr:DUF418 domain-containing protein [Dehalococcoidia bacterium]